MEALIEKLDYTGENYKPVQITDKWQIAYLNSCKECRLESIKKIDVHHHTDEAFVLLTGRAVLMAAEIKDGQVSFDLIDMEQGVNYNIPKNVWHNIALLENTRVLIIENANTHLNDYEFFYLSDDQVKRLHQDVNHLLASR
jgi:mannose-6-phosphate isomerase-like protein (cupin superfamily)